MTPVWKKPAIKYLLMSILLSSMIMLATKLLDLPTKYIAGSGFLTLLVFSIVFFIFGRDHKRGWKIFFTALALYAFFVPPASLYYFTRTSQAMFQGKTWSEIHIGLWLIHLAIALLFFLLGLGAVVLSTIILVNLRKKKAPRD